VTGHLVDHLVRVSTDGPVDIGDVAIRVLRGG
jgi:hypothetical protein